MTFISQFETLTEIIIIIMRINIRLYQVRTNNRYSETSKNITLKTQKNDLMNLNANEVNKKKCYNCEKKII